MQISREAISRPVEQPVALLLLTLLSLALVALPFLNFAPNLGNERIAVADRQAPRLDRRADPDADVDRPHEGAALVHRVTPTLDSHGDDGRLGFDGHDETTLLERKQVAGATARALGENQERVAIA